MILFLDYDGTLHPLWTFEEGLERVIATPYRGPLLTEVRVLERILEPYLPRLEIVLSSAWAHSRGLEAARDMLPKILADRVTESIWLRELELDYRSTLITRFRCIQMWLERRRPGYVGPWLALDDDDELWPADQRHHLVHALGTLKCERVQRDLAERLERSMPPCARSSGFAAGSLPPRR